MRMQKPSVPETAAGSYGSVPRANRSPLCHVGNSPRSTNERKLGCYISVTLVALVVF